MIDSRPGDMFQPGDLLNNTYRIEALLGRGGTSEVYKARSEISGNPVALKILKQEFSGNEDFTVLMAREENIREIRHDAVVRYSENHRTSDGRIYLLMDYIEGPGLDQKLKEGPMSVEDLMVICRRVSEGLQAAHKRNIVHRDLSPDNIILRGGDPEHAVIIDFGIAKDTNPGAETIVGNEFAGKYSYAAPEQMSGQTDARSDIYSLGALLLANYRGKSPSLGANPMEVVANKQKPLPTEDLPEPFKSLIERMCAPNPMERFQSAGDVLEFLKAPGALPPLTASSVDPLDALLGSPTAPLDEATIITPRSTVSPPLEPPARKEKPEAKGGKGGLIAVALIALLAIGGGGAWFSGALDSLFAPSYPAADPFRLIVERAEGGPVRAAGNVPSEEGHSALMQLVDEGELVLASGEIAETWLRDILYTLEPLAELKDWRLSVENNQASLTGKTSDADLLADLDGFFGGDMPGALVGLVNITYELPLLDHDIPRGIVESLADCGQLTLKGAAVGSGYAPDEALAVSGQVSSTETQIRIFDALSEVADGRPVQLQLDVLNPALCIVEQHLPKAPPGGVSVSYSNGATGDSNPSGRFFVGENPVIDVVLPADLIDGFLTVSILDVTGNVFHLLPNLGRQENSVATLRDGKTGEFPLRVAFSLAASSTGGGIAFAVDDSTLGKSKILILHSDGPLFDGLRPTAESAASFAEALQASASTNAGRILSLDSSILTTAQP
ncbi:protein kinase domain-containing protein [Arenibacterium sp. LLYu02]|uniref:serine/threonine protein kinase n=1 Tax=Arenibacterium sp. LLYu02 TaxID=3404132 RepID=UPI003B210111